MFDTSLTIGANKNPICIRFPGTVGSKPYRQPYYSVESRNTRSTTIYAVTSRSTTQVVPFDLPPRCFQHYNGNQRHKLMPITVVFNGNYVI